MARIAVNPVAPTPTLPKGSFLSLCLFSLVATQAATQCLVSRGTRRVATRDPFPDTPPTYFFPPWYLELVPERKA